jgi:hypothetical protein
MKIVIDLDFLYIELNTELTLNECILMTKSIDIDDEFIESIKFEKDKDVKNEKNN